MNLPDKEYEIIKKEILKRKPKKILLQAPEGMKTSVQEIAGRIRALGPKCIIWADPCFGACDIPENPAKMLGCDLIVHVGHAPFMVSKEIPVLYVECRSDADFSKVIESNLSAIPDKKIGLVATIQYLGAIPKIKNLLEKKGKEVFIAKSKSMKYKGQVLGCNAGAAEAIEDKVDCFITLASGKFHALGVAKKVQKPVFLANLDTGKIESTDKEKRLFEKKRILKLEKLKDAKNIGILVSTKRGQLSSTDDIEKKFEQENKKVWILAMDYISPEKILGMKLDALINTACPRIDEDLIFGVPVIDKSEII
ncbi:MAG: diphthamide biosynthesis enzyme Dph2 [Candidatus Aenigmarchaeota archaeon]|nr:diphthamide biosynthesis enzyme Dph2 [Candidatus Aenigmarchaeota archaeon]